MIFINRKKAKELIVEERLLVLYEFEKLKILETDYYFLQKDYNSENFNNQIDEYILNDETLSKLSPQAIDLIKNQEYLKIPFSSELNPIFQEALMRELYGVTNEYLEIVLNRNKSLYQVTGEIELMGQCPCCNFYSIDYGEDGFCDICPVCFWENGGDSPNHMSLEVAKANFKNYGAIEKAFLRSIDSEGKIKYRMAGL